MWREPFHSYPDPHEDDETNISDRDVEPRPNVPLAYAVVAVLIVIAVLVIVL
jgi:hypothetical protein